MYDTKQTKNKSWYYIVCFNEAIRKGKSVKSAFKYADECFYKMHHPNADYETGFKSRKGIRLNKLK